MIEAICKAVVKYLWRKIFEKDQTFSMTCMFIAFDQGSMQWLQPTSAIELKYLYIFFIFCNLEPIVETILIGGLPAYPILLILAAAALS